MDDNLSETKTLQRPKSYPFLVYPYGRHRKNHILCSLSQPRNIYRKSIPELSGDTQIVACCSNWLLLCRTNTHYSLWNPITSDSIRLPTPPLEYSQSISSLALSAPPDDQNCTVILFLKSVPCVLLIRPEAEDKGWTRFNFGKLLSDIIDKPRLSHSVSCNGELYALTFGRTLVRVNVDKADNIIMEPLQCNPPNTDIFTVTFQDWLVESGGEIHYILIALGGIRMKEVIEVKVFRLDFCRMVWGRAAGLNGHAIFLNESSGFSCPAIGKGVERDCIYFTFAEDKGLYSFNLKDGHLSVTLPCPNLPTPWNSPFLMPWLGSSHAQEQNKLSTVNQDVKASNKTEGKKDPSEDSEAESTRFCDLPLEILNLIADCLNLIDYMNFRATCRDCWSSAPQIRGKQSSSRLKSSPISPLLTFSNNDTSVLNFVDPKHGNRFLKTIPESLLGHKPRYSKDGWLLMSNCKDSVSFYNPFTNEVVNLPTPPQGCAFSFSMCFSSLPTSSNCIVAGFGFWFPVRVVFISVGSQEWNECLIDNDYEFLVNHSNPVFYNEAFYLLGQGGNLFFFKYKEDGLNNAHIQWEWEFLEKPKRPCKSFHQSYLLEWNGKLISVFVGQMGKWVQIFMLNIHTMNWEVVENLGNHMFCLSRSSCVATEAVIKGMENKIYFPRSHGNSILYYSLDSRRFHSNGEDSGEDYYNSKEQLLAGWIHPSY